MKSIIASRPDDARAMPGYIVADGLAEIALHQMQELLAVPDIEIVGPFPNDLQETFMFSASVVVGTTQLDAGKELIKFLRTRDAIAVIKAKGMNPAP